MKGKDSFIWKNKPLCCVFDEEYEFVGKAFVGSHFYLKGCQGVE